MPVIVWKIWYVCQDSLRFHIKYQVNICLRGLLHCGKDLISRQLAQSTVCSELSALNTWFCQVWLNLLTSTTVLEHHADCYPHGYNGKMKNQCENTYFEDRYLSHMGWNYRIACHEWDSLPRSPPVKSANVIIRRWCTFLSVTSSDSQTIGTV